MLVRRYAWYETVLGRMFIAENGESITHISFGEVNRPPAGALEECSELINSAYVQLEKYFKGELRAFDLPLEPEGTEFQRRVWEALLTIPYGETRSYGEIGRLIGNPKGSRAVGMANHNNPISIVIPCHRVIGADGSLTGYGGGLEIKKRLLELEQGSYFTEV